MSVWMQVKIKTSNKDNNIKLTLTVIYGRCMSVWIKVKEPGTRNKDNNIRLTLTVIYGRCMSAWIKVKIKTRNKDNNKR